MAILAGIDEAGLGPLLGPLVMTGTAFRVPDEHLNRCLWRTLRASCTSKPRLASRRLVVADSKQLYRRRGDRSGIGALERTALVFLAAFGHAPKSWRDLLDVVAPDATGQLQDYAWYSERDIQLPHDPSAGDVPTLANAVRRDLEENRIAIHGVHCVPLVEGEFNRLVSSTNNKSVVSLGLVFRIIDRLLRSAPDERIRISIDRQGGRVHYRDVLMTALPGHELCVVEESSERSAYRLVDGARIREIEFVTRGEQSRFAVALASVFSKYVRELYMYALNAYWTNRVEGVRPTAGYYTDAKRWLQEMSPELDRRLVDRSLLVRTR